MCVLADSHAACTASEQCAALVNLKTAVDLEGSPCQGEEEEEEEGGQ